MLFFTKVQYDSHLSSSPCLCLCLTAARRVRSEGSLTKESLQSHYRVTFPKEVTKILSPRYQPTPQNGKPYIGTERENVVSIPAHSQLPNDVGEDDRDIRPPQRWCGASQGCPHRGKVIVNQSSSLSSLSLVDVRGVSRQCDILTISSHVSPIPN